MIFFLFLLFASVFAGAQEASPQVYFSPHDHIERHLVDLIEKEEREILIAIYSFSDRQIGDALIAAKKRGVAVEVVVDPTSLKRKYPLAKMEEAGIPIFIWAPSLSHEAKHPPLMHHKFCAFGSGVLWTGSFNFTRDADENNCENVVVLKDANLTEQYRKEFLTIKEKRSLPYAKYLATHPKKSAKR